MSNSYFDFKQFRIEQDRCAMKVTTDACVFGGWAVERLLSLPKTHTSILDIGAGTGLLSLMLAQSVQDATIDAIEIDPDTAAQAKENVNRSPWSKRIHVQCIDISNRQGESNYDHIISNPPFYENDLTGPDKKKNQAHHDESLPFSKLIGSLGKNLQSTGRFYLMLPAKGFEQRLDRLLETGLYYHRLVRFHHSASHPTGRIFLEGGFDPSVELLTESIYLFGQDGEYSDRVRAVLQSYYLSF